MAVTAMQRRAGGLALMMLAGQAAHAMTPGGGIEEVVVTAEKRQDTLQNTPIALSALSGEQLAAKGIVDFTGVATATPSMYFAPYPSSNNALMLFMRGQGNADPGQITSDGAVGVYLDGVYLARPQGSTFDLVDFERVEVLRGPQGTLYGRNTTGGAVNIISRKPSGEFGFRQQLSFGNRGYFRSVTTVDLPRIGDVSAKLALLKSERDGYVKNTGNGPDYGAEAQRAGRLALRWDAGDTLVVDYTLEAGELTSTPMYFNNTALFAPLPAFGGVQVPGYRIDRERTYRPIDLPESSARYQGHALTASWDVSPEATIKSLTSYRELNSRARQNYAEAFTVYFESDDPIRNHQFSQEFQFTGTALEERIHYAAGLYYFEEGGSHDQVIRQGLPFPPYTLFTDLTREVEAEAKSEAVYAQLTWTPPLADDNLDLTLGGRYTRDRRNAARTVRDLSSGAVVEDDIRNDQRFNRFNPAFTANYRWGDDANVYAKMATGYRAGGSSESGPDFSQTFGPEKVITYELGLKAYWWQRRVRSNLAVFRTDYRDMQVLISPDMDDLSVTQTVNAGRARFNGVEVDLTFEPIDDLRFNASYAYLDAEMVEVEDLDGSDITRRYAVPFAPEHSYDLSADYTFARFDAADLALHLDYRWQGAAFLSGTSGPAVPNGDYFERPSYGLLGGRLTLGLELPRGDRARVSLWGKNIADKRYKQFTVGIGNYLGYYSQAFAYGEPRSFGIELVYDY